MGYEKFLHETTIPNTRAIGNPLVILRSHNAICTLGGFLLVVTALTITPSPDMAYILSRAIAKGAPAGIVSVAGVSIGALFHVIFAIIIYSLTTQLSE